MMHWLPNFPAVMQAILSSFKLCLSLGEVDCFCALWNKTLLLSFDVYYSSKVFIFYFKKKKTMLLMFFEVILHFCYMYFVRSGNQLSMLHEKRILMFMIQCS